MNRYKNKIVHFNDLECTIKMSKYPNGRIRMVLIDREDEQQVANVTLNIDSVPVIDDMIIIKDYRENKGVYTALLASGIIKPCDRKIAIGFEYGFICFLK